MKNKTLIVAIVLIYLGINFIYDISTFIHIKTLNNEDCGTKNYTKLSLSEWIDFWYFMSFIISLTLLIITLIYIFSKDDDRIYIFKLDYTTARYLSAILGIYIGTIITKIILCIDGGLVIFGNSLTGDDSCFYKTRALGDWCLSTFIIFIYCSIY